jgi:hypothetical protein
MLQLAGYLLFTNIFTMKSYVQPLLLIFSCSYITNAFNIFSLPDNISSKIPTKDSYNIDNIAIKKKTVTKMFYFLPNDAGLFSLFLQTKIMYRLSKRSYF